MSPDSTTADGATQDGATDGGTLVPTAVDCTHRGAGMSYEVGDGKDYATLGSVPWYALGPGDTVRIHYRTEPYREKILLSNRGAEDQPIRVCGVAGPDGSLPILDGENATTGPNQRWDNYPPLEDLGVVVVGNDEDDLYEDRPGYIAIEGLVLRGAVEEHSYTASDGSVRAWDDGAAGVYVIAGDHVTVRGCVLTGNGRGFFTLSKSEVEATLTRDILFEGNHVYENGAVGQDSKHNAYIQALGVVVQFNWFGPLREGALGGNLKDRSAGTVVRYNWFEGGARMLDLVDAQEHGDDALLDPRYRETFVYGNVFVNRVSDGARIVHYGGDTEGYEQYFRKGTLYFYHNTVVASAPVEERYNTYVLDISTNDETARFWNNVVTLDGTSNLKLARHAGNLVLGTNWVTVGWSVGSDMFAGTATGQERVISGTDPGLDPVSLEPLAGSPLIDVADPQPPEAAAYPVNAEYVIHQKSGTRAVDGAALDLGAFERTGNP